MRIRLLLLAITAIAISSHLHAQAKSQEKLNIKFGKITSQDFDLSANKFDTSAAVVVIADIGSSEFDVSMHSDKTIVYTRHKRMKILKKSGFDAADVQVRYYFSRDGEERINELKASTYNLEDGKVVETKVDSKSIFKDKLDDHNNVKKFTFPALKVGSIIEYTYTTTSDFYTSFRGWEFQGEYPVLWSEYKVAIPEMYNYIFLTQGSTEYDIHTTTSTNADFDIAHSNGARSYISINNTRWVMKNVPALKPERFTTTIDNYVSKIEFELSSIIYPMEAPRYRMGSYESLKNGLLASEYFGAPLSKSNGWLDDILKPVTQGSKNDLEKTKKIYNYVRDNYKCNDATALFINDGLKDVVKAKAGNVAELNLLLIAMLRHEKIKADPIILSTRSHGRTHEMYPILDRFNYVIAEVQINDHVYQLDASNPLLGFNHLSPKCFNGHARIVNDAMDPIYLSPDSLKERKVTLVTVKADEKGVMHGTYTSMLGYLESLDVRETVNSKGEVDYFKVIQSDNSGEMEMSNKGIDSLKMQEEPVQIRYEFTLNKGYEDMIYFNPLLNEGIKENYFVSSERTYPVEMPYATSEMYVLNMEIPNGYEIEELPKSAQVTLNEDEGTFQYLIGRNENMIQFKSVIKLNKATFQPEDYNSLREFFAQVVKKQSEQIVFKKKK